MTKLILALVLIAALLGAPQRATADETPPALSDGAVMSTALKWYVDLQTGAIDRSQLAPEYSAQLGDDAVKSLAQFMKDHAYGSAPKGTEIIMRRKLPNQTVYVVKIVFPRGDAASLMIGFNEVGKIAGLSLMSMAGD